MQNVPMGAQIIGLHQVLSGAAISSPGSASVACSQLAKCHRCLIQAFLNSLGLEFGPTRLKQNPRHAGGACCQCSRPLPLSLPPLQHHQFQFLAFHVSQEAQQGLDIMGSAWTGPCREVWHGGLWVSVRRV